VEQPGCPSAVIGLIGQQPVATYLHKKADSLGKLPADFQLEQSLFI